MSFLRDALNAQINALQAELHGSEQSPMTFETSIERVLGNEGGYVNRADDPGGETQWGISKRNYTDVDIKALTRDQAKAIYLRDFWQAGRMDEFDPAISCQVFDFAVNSGIGTALRKLQLAAGVADDGHVGPVTIAAIKAKSPTDLIFLFIAYRLKYWTGLSNWPQAGKGWANRAANDLIYATVDT